LKAARLAQQAHQLAQKAQAGLPLSDNEACPTTRPIWKELHVLKERSRAHREQHRLNQECKAKELEALEHKLMECEAREHETQATSKATTSGGRAPQAPITKCPPLGNSQLSTCNADSPTELEIALANPDLSPENRKFLGQKRF